MSTSLDSQLKDIARACVRAVDEVDRREHAILSDIKSQYPAARPRTNAPPEELSALEAKRKALILAAASRLRRAFGPAQFVLFEADARRYVGPNYRTVRAPKIGGTK